MTLEALAPFRAPLVRPAGDPQPLTYLDSAFNREAGAFDATLEVWLQTARMRTAGHAGDRLSQSSFRDAYWTAGQMVTHHTMNGCEQIRAHLDAKAAKAAASLPPRPPPSRRE